jgi:hypothetical protein
MPKQLLVEDYRRLIAEAVQPGEALRMSQLCQRLNWKTGGTPASKLKRIMPPRNEWTAVRTTSGMREIRLLVPRPGFAGIIECRAI